MGPEDGSMSCVPEAPFVTSSSCGATRKGSIQPRRQQPTRSCTSSKSSESVVLSRGESASCASKGKGKRRSDPIRHGHARSDNDLRRASITSSSSEYRTPGTSEDKATVSSRQPPDFSGRSRGNAAVHAPSGSRRRCLRSDTRREQQLGGGYSGPVLPFSRASGGGDRVETPPGSRSKDQREKSKVTPYKRPQPLGGFQSQESFAKGNVNAKRRKEKESGAWHSVSCRGPQRAAAAAAVARLNSSRHLDEMAEAEEKEGVDKHRKGKARAHVQKQQSQPLSQMPTEEAPAGAAAFASGFVESLSDGSGSGEGDFRAATGVDAPPQTSGGSLEKVWNAISATYFQDPLVVKDIVSSLLIENGDTNTSSTKSSHGGTVSGGQSLPRWAASNSGGGLSGPGRGGGGGESSLWAGSPTRWASAGGNSSLQDRSWVSASWCGVRGWEAPEIEDDNGNIGEGDWARRCKNVKRSWTGCKGVQGMEKTADDGRNMTCEKSGAVQPVPEPEACEGSSPAVPTSEGSKNAETLAISATESTSGLSVGSGSDSGSVGMATVKEEPTCSDGNGENSDKASAPAAAFLTPKTELVSALSVIEPPVEIQAVESTVGTDNGSADATERASNSPKPTVPVHLPQSPSIVMPLPLRHAPPVPSPHRVNATSAVSLEQSHAATQQLDDTSRHPQPLEAAKENYSDGGISKNATTTAGTPDIAPTGGVCGIDLEETSLPGVSGDAVQGEPFRREGDGGCSYSCQTNAPLSPVSLERTASAFEENLSTFVEPSSPQTERFKPTSLPREKSPSSLQPQPRPQDQLLWPPVPLRPYPSGFVGMLSSREPMDGGASSASVCSVGNPHSGVANGDCGDRSWCHQRPVSTSPSREVHGSQIIQPRIEVSNNGVSGSDSCGGGSGQKNSGEEVDEVSLRLSSVSEALNLLEDAAILPSLYRVSDALRMELDRRAEDRAKATAASRIERAWRSACNARSPSSHCPAKKYSRVTSCWPRGSGSEGMDSDVGLYNDGAVDRYLSGKAVAGGEWWHQNGGVMVRGGRGGDGSDDEWSLFGRGSKRRRCARRLKSAGKPRAGVGGDATSTTSNSESESESAVPLSSIEDRYKVEGSMHRTHPRCAQLTENDSLFPIAGSAVRKLRSRASLGGGMGRLKNGRSRCGSGGNRVRGWEKTTSPRRKLACLSGSGGTSITFVPFAANSPECSSEGYMSSSDGSMLGGGSRGSGSGRRRYGDRGYGQAGRKRHICRELTCTRRAHYGSPGWVPAHCVFHRRDWEVLLKYASCLSEGCVDKPAFGVPGDLSRVYCRRHKVPGAVGLASAGWKFPEDSREAEPGGWVEAEEDGMGVLVDEVAVEETEREEDVAMAEALPDPIRASSAPENVFAAKAVSSKLEVVPMEGGVEEESMVFIEPAPVQETAMLPVTESDPAADDFANGSTTSEASVTEDAGSLTQTKVRPESPHAMTGATSLDNSASAMEEVSPNGGDSGRGDGANVDGQDAVKRKGRWFREVGKGIAVLKEIREIRDGSAVGGRARKVAKKGNDDKTKSSNSNSGKLMKGKGKAKSRVGRVPRGRKGAVGRRSTRSATLRSSDTDGISDSDTFSSQESDSESESDSDVDGDDEDIVDDPVFAPGRFVFLVPSKKCGRPILVGKIVSASELPSESSSRSGSASTPPPTIPVSSTTALLLAKAAALLVGTSNPDADANAETDPAASASGAEKEVADAAKDEERRWIHVHWHTPASLNRKDYCRGPFTPDYVKKESSKFGGWDPFVTKIRKKSVVVSCPGLLVSRCIPAEALRELGV